MLTADRRALLIQLSAIIGAPLAGPIGKALAAEAPAGFAASRELFTPDQRALAAAVSECIVPTTDTPGAIAAGVPAFLEMMLADWYDAGERDNFLAGLNGLDGAARTRFGKTFAVLASEQQDMVLTAAMDGTIAGLPQNFFTHCRQMVLLGYYSSEIGCTVERRYLPVPGHYDGAYPYASVQRIFSS